MRLGRKGVGYKTCRWFGVNPHRLSPITPMPMSSAPRRQNTTYHHVEHTVYNSNRGSTITRGTVASYHRARGSLQPYPGKDVILARGRNFRGEDHDNRDLYFGDMIFANAVAADYRLRDEHCANFKP
jgi:hypothetical protein